MFLPANAVSLDPGHLFPTSATTGAVNALHGFLDDVNGEHGGTLRAAVVSTAGSAAVPVTQVRTDQRPDIQRRRANQQPNGTYATATLSS